MDSLLDSLDPRDRWTSLIASAFLMLTCGTMYLFSAFSGDLAELMHYNTTELNNIGTSGMLGAWAALFGGMFCDRYGPRRTAYCSGVMVSVGWIAIALSCDGVFPKSSWFVAAMMLIVGQGSGWGYIAANKAALGNFHFEERGTLLGGLVCYFALCGGLYAQTFKIVFRPNFSLSGFFWAMGISVVIAHLCCARVIHTAFPATHLAPNEVIRMRDIRYLGLAVAGILLLTSLGELLVDSIPLARFFWFILACLMGVLGFAPWIWRKREEASNISSAPPAGENAISPPSSSQEMDNGLTSPPETTEVPKPNETASSSREEAKTSTTTPQNDATSAKAVVSAAEDVDGPPVITFKQILHLKDYWIWVLCYMTALSYGIVVINNLATLVAAGIEMDMSNCGKSIAKPCVLDSGEEQTVKTRTAVLVALFAVFNAVGRVVFGQLADQYKEKHPRISWMAVSTGIICLAGNLLLLLFFHFFSLVLGTALAGFGLGGVFSVAPLSTSELFGVKNFGATWGLTGVAPGLSTVLLSTLLAGRMTDSYTAQSTPLGEGEDARLPWVILNGHRYCHGWKCYSVTFTVTGLVLAISAASALVIVKRLKDGSCKMYS